VQSPKVSFINRVKRAIRVISITSEGNTSGEAFIIPGRGRGSLEESPNWDITWCTPKDQDTITCHKPRKEHITNKLVKKLGGKGLTLVHKGNISLSGGTTEMLDVRHSLSTRKATTRAIFMLPHQVSVIVPKPESIGLVLGVNTTRGTLPEVFLGRLEG
jgi:hypothetical protein